MREAIRLRHPAEIFPFGANTGRHVDLDHTIPYLPPDKDGPCGQTSLSNLGPLSRSNHRLKTHAPGWSLRQPVPGIYLCRTPHGYISLTTNNGTLNLGNNAFAQKIWNAADTSPIEVNLANAI